MVLTQSGNLRIVKSLTLDRCGLASLVSRMADLTLTSRIFSMALSGMSRMRPAAGLTAALDTSTSTLPYESWGELHQSLQVLLLANVCCAADDLNAAGLKLPDGLIHIGLPEMS